MSDIDKREYKEKLKANDEEQRRLRLQNSGEFTLTFKIVDIVVVRLTSRGANEKQIST